MLIQKKHRFLIASIVASIALIAGLLKLFGTSRFTYGSSGQLITLYPHPFEVMMISVAVTLLLLWLYQWYQRDPVQHIFKTLGDDERQQMFELLVRGGDKPKRGQGSNSDINRLTADDEDDLENEVIDKLPHAERRHHSH